MSLKIKVSYTEEEEATAIMTLFRPVLSLFKVKKSEGKPPFKHLYFTPKNGGKPRQ